MGLSAATSKESTRVRLLCSLAASSTPKAVFEDVTDITPITISKGSVIFETKVSALFWAVFLEEPSVESMTALLPSAQYLYEEIMLTPYMANCGINRRNGGNLWFNIKLSRRGRP